MKFLALIIMVLPLLAGCDQLQERLGIPVSAKVEAEGEAIGSACRHAGRGLEDCYNLNPKASKPAIFMGWKDMNEYMMKNNMQAVPPQVTPPSAFTLKRQATEEEKAKEDAKKVEGDEKAADTDKGDKTDAKGH